jgi:hypothetical protein
MALTKVGKEGITGISNSSDATAITIDSSENVGIGTSSPGTFRTKIKQSGTGTTQGMGVEASANDSVLRLFHTGSAAGFNATYSSSGAYVPLTFDIGGSERLRVDINGHVLFGQSSTDSPGVGNTTAGAAIRSTGIGFFSSDGSAPLRLNRQSDDGVLINFYREGVAQGFIGVSSGTVSLTGAHLSRWSQATDGQRISGLLRGTVMTNLDQMAVWTNDGVTEDNEQLNCMAVSSVEGDANVAGVFQSWDDDDDVYLNDMIIAMTGDFIIRIASGTTVARGDLLMSAGDGTAKPQGDDIVRSKTIAKVTSTTVSHTYDDGTYLVPCVLMAC